MEADNEAKKITVNLDFTDVEVRKAFIHETESGLYGGKNILDQPVTIFQEKGVGMEIRTLLSTGWYECVSYGENGYQEDVSYRKG